MLRRRSIKTKLLVALFFLLASVCSLTFSGWFGLNRYRDLAESASQATEELGYANGLSGFAEQMRQRLQSSPRYGISGSMMRSGEPRIEMPLSLSPLVLELEVDQALFEGILERYKSKAGSERYHNSRFFDPKQRRTSLTNISDKFENLKATFAPEEADYLFVSASERNACVDELLQATANLAGQLQDRIDPFNAEMKATYRRWNTITLSSAAFAILLICILLWSLWTMLVQPFRTLLDGSRLVAKGEFAHRIYLDTGDELDELAEAMNAMSDKFHSAYSGLDELRKNLEREVQDRTREVIRNEQLASVGFLAAGVAHEINNPLTSIAWAAESLESQIEECPSDEPSLMDGEILEATQTTLRQIQDEAFRCKGITDRLLDFSRMSEVRREATDLAKLVQDVADLVSKVGEFRCKSVVTHCKEPVIAEVSAHQVRQVVLNLITNALESVGADGKVEVTVRQDESHAFITVVDNGCGMTEEVITHLFEPFFTRRRDGTGTGLGLSITYRIVSQHGGKLIPYSQGEGKGSTMELMLPLVQESAAQEETNSQAKWNHEVEHAA